MLHGGGEDAFGGGGDAAELVDHAVGHAGVGVDAGAVAEPVGLDVACAGDALADLGGGFAVGWAAQVAVVDGGDFDLDVNPVEEGAAGECARPVCVGGMQQEIFPARHPCREKSKSLWNRLIALLGT